MPEVLHTLTKPGGVRLVPKAGKVAVTFPTGWNGNKSFTWAIVDEDITPTSIIVLTYSPQLRTDGNGKIVEATDDWEFDDIKAIPAGVTTGLANISLLAPKQRLVGVKTFTYLIFEP